MRAAGRRTDAGGSAAHQLTAGYIPTTPDSFCVSSLYFCVMCPWAPPLCTPFHQLVPLWLDFRGIWSVPSTIWPKSKFIGQNLGKFHFEVNFHQPPPCYVVSSASAVRYFSWNLIVQSPDASATFSSFSVVQWNPPITKFQVNNPLSP